MARKYFIRNEYPRFLENKSSNNIDNANGMKYNISPAKETVQGYGVDIGVNMIELTKEEIVFLQKNISNWDEISDSNILRDILLPLDEWIIAYGYDEDWSFNDEGRKAQNIYDDIYCRNIAEYE